MFKKIQDPIHGTLIIEKENKFIWDLIQTKEFNRLIRINQLGLVNLLFPSATHSRKSHSLGVYELARRALVVLDVKDALIKKAILAASLLHDIGHGPLSHLFETISKFEHEHYSVSIILNKNSEVHKVLVKENKKLPSIVADIINKTHKTHWVSSLLSSEMDVDRLDYLIRDTYFTGHKFGQTDIAILINYMKIKDDKLVFREKAIPHLESMLLTRYRMFANVYAGQKNLLLEKLANLFFTRVKILIKQNYDFKIDVKIFEEVFENKKLDLSSFMKLDDIYIWNIFKTALEEKDHILKTVATHLVNSTLPEYTEITKSVAEKKISEREDNLVFAVQKNWYKTTLQKKERALVEVKNQTFTLDKISKIISVNADENNKINTEYFQIKF